MLRKSRLLPFLILLLLIGGVGVFGARPIVAALLPSRDHPTPPAIAVPAIHGVPTYAPAAGGAIAGVYLVDAATYKDGVKAPADYSNPNYIKPKCELSGSCTVTVVVAYNSLLPVATLVTVKFYDRCLDATTDLSVDTDFHQVVTYPAGMVMPRAEDIMAKTLTLYIPAGTKAFALVALTTSPTQAASAPLAFGAASCA